MPLWVAPWPPGAARPQPRGATTSGCLPGSTDTSRDSLLAAASAVSRRLHEPPVLHVGPTPAGASAGVAAAPLPHPPTTPAIAPHARAPPAAPGSTGTEVELLQAPLLVAKALSSGLQHAAGATAVGMALRRATPPASAWSGPPTHLPPRPAQRLGGWRLRAGGLPPRTGGPAYCCAGTACLPALGPWLLPAVPAVPAVAAVPPACCCVATASWWAEGWGGG